MRLDLMTWIEVEAYLKTKRGIILPTGSTEQHGPLGLIGTDAICARTIARRAADASGTLVAPDLAYTPAPFNMSFPGSVSIPAALFQNLAQAVIDSFAHHGFDRIYILNGHGANLDPLHHVAQRRDVALRIKSWWDFPTVNALRTEFYGDWEGVHATPSEIAITQHTDRLIPDPGLAPPRPLSKAERVACAGDRHGPPDAHRRAFPDGRVGSHSGLARPAQGAALLQAAATAVADDVIAFTTS